MYSGEELPTPQLQVGDLYKRRQSRDTARLKAYNKILEIIHHRIRTISEFPNSPCSLLYTIPPFILGLPRIDLEDCVVYITYQLRMTGFDVRYTYPNLLNINWAHHEKSYLLEQSPIMMAMVESEAKKYQEDQKKAIFAKNLVKKIGPPAPKNTKPEGPRKSVGFRKQVVNNSVGAPSVGHMPSASDYIPPTAFLKQMTEPKKTAIAAVNAGPSRQSNPFADLWNT